MCVIWVFIHVLELRNVGIIWLLLLIGHLYSIGVRFGEDNEQTPYKLMFKEDWTTCWVFINYFTLNNEYNWAAH
jgi:hypothetical protein